MSAEYHLPVCQTHRYIPKRRTPHIHCLLVFIRLSLVVGANVGESRDTIDAGCALEELYGASSVGGLCGEGFGGEAFGDGEEVRGVFVVVGVVDVVLGCRVSLEVGIGGGRTDGYQLVEDRLKVLEGTVVEAVPRVCVSKELIALT